jgi:predicted DNA-binding transcriptional regulator YafY
MDATLSTLLLLRVLSEGPASREQLINAVEEELGVRRETRQFERYVRALKDSGFEVLQKDGRYELLHSPAKLLFSDRETLATLNVVESLAEKEPVYGEHLASAARKLREVLPDEAIRFADAGRVQFDLSFASNPPEDPSILDTLRRATHQHRKVEIFYYSLSSGGKSWRTVQPLNLSYAQRAHRLYTYEPDKGDVTEFRINRVDAAKMLPDKFSPEAYIRRFEKFRVRLSKNAFIAYGKSIFQDPFATIEPLEDGGAIIEGRTPSPFWTVREIAALGPDAEVLGGPKLKEEFLNFLQDTQSKYF